MVMHDVSVIGRILRGVALLPLFAIVFGLAAAPAGAAPGDPVQSLLIKFRDDALPPGASELPTQDWERVAGALGVDFTETGRTRDGAFEIRLVRPLAFDDARAALNRVRMLRGLLYATFVPTFTPPSAAAAQAGAIQRSPTNRIVVKYKDPAANQRALAGNAPDRAQLDRLAVAAGESLAFVRPMHDGAQVLELMRRNPIAAVEAMAARIAALPDVEWAQPDYIDRIALIPTDPCYASASVAACGSGFQWDLFDPIGGINAPAAWDLTTGSPSIVVGVIDTGALFSHPDLAGRFLPGYDMIADCAVANDGSAPCTFSPLPYSPANPPIPSQNSRDSDAADPGDWVTMLENNPEQNPPPPPFYDYFAGCGAENSSWHGTHLAGTIGAVANNGTGIVGINWVSRILPVRVLGKCGGYASDISDGITWASGGAVPGVPANPTPARVLNLSLGGYRSNQTCDPAYATAINGALSRSTVIAVSAGNANYDTRYAAPANCPGVITVAATGEKGFKSYYSNWGTQIEIAAPGGDARVEPTYNPNGRGILSTLNAGTTVPGAFNFVQYQGTSMAAPHVAGVASLMLSRNPTLTPAQVLSLMQTSARAFPTGAPACDRANDPLTNPIPSASWRACTCTTALCGAGLLNAGAAVTAVPPPPPNDRARAGARRDFNDDGRSDIAWSNSGSGEKVAWLMNGTAFAGGSSLLTNPSLSITHFGDFNGDRKTDLVWRNSATGETVLWIMNGAAYAGGGVVVSDPNWRVTHVGDFNGDARTDLVLRNAMTGQTAIWFMNGAAFAGGGVILSNASWSVTQVGDFNGDRMDDLVWRNSATGETAIWIMNGATFAGGGTIMSNPSWSVTHVGDFNGDGKADLVWRHATQGTAVWLMSGVTLMGGAGLHPDPNWTIAAVDDLNGDGRADVLLRHSPTGDTAAWLMNGATLSTGGSLLPGPNWNIAGTGDFNGDGRADILWRNASTGENVMWLMNGLGILSGATLLSSPAWSIAP